MLVHIMNFLILNKIHNINRKNMFYNIQFSKNNF